MELVKSDNIYNLLNNKIEIEMSVADFLSFYLAKMTCLPSDFKEYSEEVFPDIKDIDLFTYSTEIEAMEEIIDQIGFPHRDWFAV